MGRDQEGAGSMNLFVLRTWLQAKFTTDERGASMVEYILLVALIALAVIAAVVFLRGQTAAEFAPHGKQEPVDQSRGRHRRRGFGP